MRRLRDRGDIQGLFAVDRQTNYYGLLARVMLARFLRKRRLKNFET